MLHELEKPVLIKRTLRRYFHRSCSVVVVLLWICMVHLAMALASSVLYLLEKKKTVNQQVTIITVYFICSRVSRFLPGRIPSSVNVP